MDQRDWLAERFEENRRHLRLVAYRMLGSLTDADDAVQKAWLRLSRADTGSIENLGGWLTTVVARVSLDMLRARKARREDFPEENAPEPFPSLEDGADPEHEVLLAESVGLALLVVLDTLNPAERIAFVLHDMFDLPFDEIAPIVGRSPAAARQLASRARRRVRGTETASDADLTRRREVVEAFLTASRAGDFEALLAVLDPDVVFRADRFVVPPAGSEVHSAQEVASGAVRYARRSRFARPALVDGDVGLVLAPRGRLVQVMRLTVMDGRISEMELIADPERLRRLDLAVLDD
jgi:RNA polymerase sigma-70 factor (ECF subfamily)